MLKMILELVANALGVVKGWLDWKSSGVGQLKAAEGMVVETASVTFVIASIRPDSHGGTVGIAEVALPDGEYDYIIHAASNADPAAKRRRAEINRAVHEGDDDTVNRIVNGLCVAACVSLALVAGCASPEPAYVAADRHVTCVTNATGAVEYWRVPPLVMEELLNAKVELGELKKELKVKEITK